MEIVSGMANFPSGSVSKTPNEASKFVYGKRDFPAGCGKKRWAAEMESDPDTFKWWRDVPAVKKLHREESLTNNNKNPPPIIKKPNPNEEKTVGTARKVVVLDNVKVVVGENMRRESGVEKRVAKMPRERERLLGVLSMFRERVERISKHDKHVRRVDNRAFTELKREGKIVTWTSLPIGHVPGVEIGDKFCYRIELVIAGLHRQTQGGIDTKEVGMGTKVATCIVANEGYLDKMSDRDPNYLVYVGEGGRLQRYEAGVPPDQKMEGGNRALYNSMREGRPVRVVRGLKMGGGCARSLYVYDGLYEVKECVKKRERLGNLVFEFHMFRCPWQPPVNWVRFRLSG